MADTWFDAAPARKHMFQFFPHKTNPQIHVFRDDAKSTDNVSNHNTDDNNKTDNYDDTSNTYNNDNTTNNSNSKTDNKSSSNNNDKTDNSSSSNDDKIWFMTLQISFTRFLSFVPFFQSFATFCRRDKSSLLNKNLK